MAWQERAWSLEQHVLEIVFFVGVFVDTLVGRWRYRLLVMSFQSDGTFVVRDGDFFFFKKCILNFEKSTGPKSGCQVCWGDVYAVAMNAIGPLPLQTAPEEYGEFGPWVDPTVPC